MRARLFVFLLLVLSCFVANVLINDVVHPSLSADVSVSQLDDTEASAVAMRSYDRFNSSFPVVSWSFVAFMGLFMFRADLKRSASQYWSTL